MTTPELRIRDLEILNSIPSKVSLEMNISRNENHADPREIVNVLASPLPQQGPFFGLVREGSTISWKGVLRYSLKQNAFELRSTKNETVFLPAESLIDIGYVDNGMLLGARSFRSTYFALTSRSMKMDIKDAFRFFIPPLDYDWKSTKQTFMQHIGYGNTDMINAVARSSHVDSIPVAGRPPLGRVIRQELPLNYAVFIGRVESVISLLRNGYDPNAANDQGIYSGFKAASAGSEVLIDILSKHNTNWNIADKRGLTPLHIAVMNEEPGAARILLSLGASASAVDEDGLTPLHYIGSKDIDLIDSLIDFGANVNVRDSEGNSPLHIAITNELPATIKRLIERGGDLNLENDAGDSAISMIGDDLKMKLGW